MNSLRRHSRILVLSALSVLLGCRAIVGVEDARLVADGGVGGAAGGTGQGGIAGTAGTAQGGSSGGGTAGTAGEAGSGGGSCGAGLTDCGNGDCVNLQIDHDHCGDCAKDCGDDAICKEGGCVPCKSTEMECSNVCVDRSSNENCGDCGRVCETQCKNELCAPSLVASAGLTSTIDPMAFVLRDSDLFWLEGGLGAIQATLQHARADLPKLPLDVSLTADQCGYEPRQLTESAGVLYWTARPQKAGTEWHLFTKKEGDPPGPAADVVNIGGEPTALAADATAAYWTVGTQVFRFNFQSPPPAVPITENLGNTPSALTLDDTNVYFALGGEIRKIPKGANGGPGTPIVTGQPPARDLIHFGGALFWIAMDGGQHSIRFAPAGGGNAAIVQQGLDNPRFTVDGNGVYYSSGQEIWYSQAAEKTDALVQSESPSAVLGIAVNTQHIYWPTDKSIYRVNK